MNPLLQVLVAMALIAVMILFRMVADERVLRLRRRCGHATGSSCSHDCSKDEERAKAGAG